MKSITYVIRVSLLLLLTTLAGCVLPGSIAPDTTTADELVKKLGKPDDVRPNPNGGENWDYTFGPEGFFSWRYTVDGKRVVRKVEQLLTEERLFQVMPGVSREADVVEALGPPRVKLRLPYEIAWEWRVQLRPTPGLYIVTFGYDGLVRSRGIIMDESRSGDFSAQ